MVRLIYAAIVGLVGAGIVHIAILLLLPVLSEQDSWSRLDTEGDLYTFVPLHGVAGKRPIVKSYDPLFEARACRFDLSEGIVHVFAAGSVPFWSVSVYDRNGQNIYSFNDRTATSGQLDFVVLTPPQMIDVRKELPEALVSSVFVEADIDQGIALVRVFVPDASWAPQMTRYIDGLICRRE